MPHNFILKVVLSIDVSGASTCCGEAFPTIITLVWLLTSMFPHVSNKLSFPDHPHFTDVTLERFLTSVRPDVIGKFRFISKTLVANVTTIVLLTTMYCPDVYEQGTFVDEPLFTEVALIRPRVRVCEDVPGQGVMFCKTLPTQSTFVRRGEVVFFTDVIFQCGCRRKLLGAVVALPPGLAE